MTMDGLTITLCLLFLFSAVVAFLVTKIGNGISKRHRILDVPNPRSSHTQPIARLGGIGIVAGVMLSFAIAAALHKMGLIQYPFPSHSALVMLLGGLGIAATGLYDDIRGLQPAKKFIFQFVMAVFVVACGARIESVTFLKWGPLTLGLLSVPVTLLWLIGVVNAFNFMDGIDGIAASTAGIYCYFFLIFALWESNSEVAALTVLVAGSSVGFLFHNFPKARTFMGDTGSMFLGFMVAMFVVLLAQKSSNPAMLIALMLVCIVYLWDVGYTLLRRLRRGENIFQAHRSHLYQRLVRSGQTHARITCVYFLFHVLVGSLAFAYLRCSFGVQVAVLVTVFVGVTSFTVSVSRLEKRAAASKSHVKDE
jgi:UDP-GlcNAc:undecaprenyl-phosphate GlcNAc-1-phosphate transferase